LREALNLEGAGRASALTDSVNRAKEEKSPRNVIFAEERCIQSTRKD